jgi:hypothetical protein
MNSNRSSALAWWSALTILVSAFLLFQVQPVISKKILPWFGGSPAVWTTCVLFFQLVLLGGYAYAHWLIRYVPPSRQGIIHLTVLVLALATFPITPAGIWNITPSAFWKPLSGEWPAARILLLLLAKVGAPFFVASTTGPLVQAWFSQLYPGRSPYRLYALSNVGSLAALLTYPFFIETNFKVDNQGWMWALGFIVFAGLVGFLARTIWSEARRTTAADDATAAPAAAEGLVAKPTAGPEAKPDAPPSTSLRIGWLTLAALASMALLAVTNHLCQDIAVVPFMWVIPLSIYLLSFIICFDNERWYVRKLFGAAAVLGVLWLTAMYNYSDFNRQLEWPQRLIRYFTTNPPQPEASGKATTEQAPPKIWAKISQTKPYLESPFSYVMNKVFEGLDWTVRKTAAITNWLTGRKYDWKFHIETYDFRENVIAASAAYIFVLFLICMVCHGELVKFKPAPQYLTSFYLSISAGGALGGLFVALICPLVFKLHFELSLSIIGGFLVGCVALANDGRLTWLKGREVLQWTAAFLLVGGVLIVARGNYPKLDSDLVTIERNFYGTVYVTKMGEGEDEGRALYNGRIWHGFQYLNPARQLEATTYYVDGTGAALAVKQNPRAGQGLRVAVIGLGTGSMAAHASKGDDFTFYDIDPKVVKVARTYFTYLEKNRAGAENTHVVLGDARISMERELKEKGSQNYDVIVLDAFSSDAIPAHLLTDESFALYEQHLRKDESGKPSGVVAIHISNRYLDLEPVCAAIANKYGYKTLNVHKSEEGGATDTGSDWVLVSKNEQFMNNPAVKELGEPLKPEKELLWTDQFTALFPILK